VMEPTTTAVMQRRSNDRAVRPHMLRRAVTQRMAVPAPENHGLTS
jgi:hypothetical protein